MSSFIVRGRFVRVRWFWSRFWAWFRVRERPVRIEFGERGEKHDVRLD